MSRRHKKGRHRRPDCYAPEPDPIDAANCRWCGRPLRVTYPNRKPEYTHLFGFPRMHADPRRAAR